MILLQSWYANPFDSKNISDDNLKKFCQKHLALTVARNGGGTFTTMLSDTTNAYTNYFGAIDDEDVKLAVQQSLTMSSDNLIATFKSEVSKRSGTIKGLYGETSPTWQEFFPHGLTEYAAATKGAIDTLMNRMAVACTAHVADLGAPFVAVFTGIKSNYATARTSQLNKIGEVTNAKTTTSGNRNGLEIQLLKNMFTVGEAFPGDVNACIGFFDQSIVRASQSSASDGIGRARGIIKSGGIAIKDAVFDYPLESVASRKSKNDGGYLSANVNIGLRHFKVSHPLYKDFEGDINIVDEGDTDLDITLDPL